jgi:RNA polymerase sigma factor (TIGR02999 family)
MPCVSLNAAQFEWSIPMSDVDKVVEATSRGESQPAEQLLPLVYEALRTLAARKLAVEKPGQTLQATALVHEAYLRLLKTRPNQPWGNRAHFFAAAAEAMRRILVENARKKRSRKGGGGHLRLQLGDVDVGISVDRDEVLALDEALEKLRCQGSDQGEPRQASLLYGNDHRRSRPVAGNLDGHRGALLGVCPGLAAVGNAARRRYGTLKFIHRPRPCQAP